MADFKSYDSSSTPLTPARRASVLADARQHLFQARAAREGGDPNRANAHLAQAGVYRDKAAANADAGFHPHRSGWVHGDIKPTRKLP